MKRIRRRASGKVNNLPVPVLLAAAFLLAAVVSFLRYQTSPEKQAERWLGRMYTATRRVDVPALCEKELPLLMEERFSADLTEQGMQSILEIGAPYILLFRDGEPKVERTYVEAIVLSELPGNEKAYDYRVQVDSYLDKNGAVLAPVEEMSYSGIIIMKKDRFLHWAVDSVTVGGATQE